MTNHNGTHMPGDSPLVPDEPPCQDCTAYGDVHYLKGGGFMLLVHHDETCPRLLALYRCDSGGCPGGL